MDEEEYLEIDEGLDEELDDTDYIEELDYNEPEEFIYEDPGIHYNPEIPLGQQINHIINNTNEDELDELLENEPELLEDILPNEEQNTEDLESSDTTTDDSSGNSEGTESSETTLDDSPSEAERKAKEELQPEEDPDAEKERKAKEDLQPEEDPSAEKERKAKEELQPTEDSSAEKEKKAKEKLQPKEDPSAKRERKAMDQMGVRRKDDTSSKALEKAKNRGPQNQAKENAKNREKDTNKNNKEKSKLQQKQEEAVGKLMSSAAQAYGIPKPIADAVSKKLAEPVIKMQKFKMKMTIILIVTVLVFFLLILMTATAVANEGDRGTESKNEYLYGSGTSESLHSFLIEMDYCEDEESCEGSPAAIYYETLKAEMTANRYINNQEAEVFINSFITFEREQDEIFAAVEEIEYIADIIGGSKFTLDKVEDYRDDFIADDGYFVTYRQDLLEESSSSDYMSSIYDTVLVDIVDEYERMEKYVSSSSRNYGCTQIIVTGELAGTYDLEDYVAKVVTAENDWGINENLENRKAHAIAVRTKVIKDTNNCTYAVNNTYGDLKISETASEKATAAAEATKGKVLVDSAGEYIDIKYDEFCLSSSDDNNYYIVQKNLAIPKSWASQYLIPDSYLTTTCTVDGNSDNGQGISIWGSRYLAAQGSTYDQILATFYETATISTAGAYSEGIEMASSGFAKRVSRALRDNQYIYSGLGLEGECAWYAVGRTNEILAGVGSNVRVTGGGNGNGFCYASDYSQFPQITDINQFKPGMIISWDSDKSIAGHEFGHVAVIEDVHYDSNGNVESIDVSEGGISSGTGMRTTFQYPGYSDLYIAESKTIWNLSDGTYKNLARQYVCEGSLDGSTGNGCQKFTNIKAANIKNRWSGYSFICAIDLLG